MSPNRSSKTIVAAYGVWGRGGAEYAAAHTLQFLSTRYCATLFTQGGFDFDSINALAGTSLSPEFLHIRTVRQSIGFLGGLRTTVRFHRELNSVGREFDARVSLSEILPWNREAIHLASSVQSLGQGFPPGAHIGLRQRLSSRIRSWFSPNPGPMYGDTIICNSHWLSNHISTKKGVTTAVAYPPIAPPGRLSPWKDRDQAVLAFGRISPEKKCLDIVDIVARTRTLGPALRLDFVGPVGCPSYLRNLREKTRELDWVEIKPPVQGGAKQQTLERYRFAINACKVEAFGISTAEMACAGILVLCPTGTGQDEIIRHPELTFSDNAEASLKLASLAKSTESGPLSARLARETAKRFSQHDYFNSVQRVLSQHLD